MTDPTRPVRDQAAEAQREGDYCCQHGCGHGACETCPCCCAGWCVMGTDGLPDEADDLTRWIEVAAEHNPIAAALLTARATVDRVRAYADSLDKSLPGEWDSVLVRHVVGQLRALDGTAQDEPRPACWCGDPTDRSRVHRATECVWWSENPIADALDQQAAPGTAQDEPRPAAPTIPACARHGERRHVCMPWCRTAQGEPLIGDRRALGDASPTEPHPPYAERGDRTLRRALDGTAQDEPRPVHLGNRANAEDCPACDLRELPYPFICPAEEGAPAAQGEPLTGDPR